MGKYSFFAVNLGICDLQINDLKTNNPCSEGLNTHLWGFEGDRWENTDSFYRVNLGM